jgi:hypothetical protein
MNAARSPMFPAPVISRRRGSQWTRRWITSIIRKLFSRMEIGSTMTPSSFCSAGSRTRYG